MTDEKNVDPIRDVVVKYITRSGSVMIVPVDVPHSMMEELLDDLQVRFGNEPDLREMTVYVAHLTEVKEEIKPLPKNGNLDSVSG